MNNGQCLEEDYSRFYPGAPSARGVFDIQMPCGRKEQVIVEQTDLDPVFTVMMDSHGVLDSTHTFEQCIKDGHDTQSFQAVVDQMTRDQVPEFILEVPFFRIDNFKARMGVKFIRNRSGKYNMYSYHHQSKRVRAEVPFGSYSGGGRGRILADLLDEIGAQLDDMPPADKKDQMDSQGYLICRTGSTQSGHRSDWIVLQAKLMRNKKFWNIWIETHVGYCVMCYATADELPPRPIGVSSPHSVDNPVDNTVYSPVDRKVVTRFLNGGKLPPVSAGFNPNAPIDPSLLNEINGNSNTQTATKARPKVAWKPK